MESSARGGISVKPMHHIGWTVVTKTITKKITYFTINLFIFIDVVILV